MADAFIHLIRAYLAIIKKTDTRQKTQQCALKKLFGCKSRPDPWARAVKTTLLMTGRGGENIYQELYTHVCLELAANYITANTRILTEDIAKNGRQTGLNGLFSIGGAGGGGGGSAGVHAVYLYLHQRSQKYVVFTESDHSWICVWKFISDGCGYRYLLWPLVRISSQFFLSVKKTFHHLLLSYTHADMQR